MGYFIWILFCVIAGAVIGNEAFDEPTLGGVIGLAVALLGMIAYWSARSTSIGTVLDETIGDLAGDGLETIADVLDD